MIANHPIGDGEKPSSVVVCSRLFEASPSPGEDFGGGVLGVEGSEATQAIAIDGVVMQLKQRVEFSSEFNDVAFRQICLSARLCVRVGGAAYTRGLR